jgi:hypothetical protein
MTANERGESGLVAPVAKRLKQVAIGLSFGFARCEHPAYLAEDGGLQNCLHGNGLLGVMMLLTII